MFRRQSFSAYLVIVLLIGVLLAACRSAAQPRPVGEAAAVSTNTPSPTLSATLLSPVPTTDAATATRHLPPATPSPTPSPAAADLERGRFMTPEPPRPTRTLRPTPTPQKSAPTPFPCPTRRPNESIGMVWERSGALPLDISLADAHYTFRPPRDLYVAVQNWIGIVRLDEPEQVVTDPYSILTYGFEEVPGLPAATDVEAQANSLLYLTGDFRLTILYADDPCYLVQAAAADFPFPADDVEVEGQRVYVGGQDSQGLHIAVLDQSALPELQQLMTLTYPPGVWSAVGEQLLTYDPATATVTISDLSDLSAVATRQVVVPVEAERIGIGPPQLFDDALALLLWDEGLMTMSGLLDEEPVVTWREFDTYFHLDFPMMQANHTFVVYNWCDVGCTSGVYIADRDPEGEFAFFSLYPHYPVFYYQAVQDDVVLGFSDYSLIVIDRDAPPGQHVVRTYPLRGGVEQ